MNHHNRKYPEQNLPHNRSNNVCQQDIYGNFELSASDIWNDLNSNLHDDDDDNDTLVKQDYDLDNLYSREHIETEEQTDSIDEDDDNMDNRVNKYDSMWLNDTVEISRRSTRKTQLQPIDEQHVLSQKFSQLSTCSNNDQIKSPSRLLSTPLRSPSSSNKNIQANAQINNLGKIPDYLTTSNKSLQNMLSSKLPLNDKINQEKLEDFRQLAIFIHHIKYNEILHQLWSVYLKSGLGTLQSKYDLQKKLNAQVWPMSIKSKIKIDPRSNFNQHHAACLTLVNDYLTELEKVTEQSRSNLHQHLNRLSHYSLSNIQQTIETFVEDKLSYLRKKIQFKIELTYHYYDERILELKYLRYNPSEVQIELANQCCKVRQQKELTKYELELLEKRITHHRFSSSSSSSSSFNNLPIARVSLFDSIDNINIREQLYTEYQQVFEQSRKDMFNLYIDSARTQMQQYQREYHDEFKRICQNQTLTRSMIDLIEQRSNIIAERIKCIYNFKAQTLSVQS